MSIFKELNIQTKNLKTLAYYLLSLPEGYTHFDMSDFRQEEFRGPFNSTKESLIGSSCGTAGCAIGHAPMLANVPAPYPEETWPDYSNRFAFGTLDDDTTQYQDDLWQWFFSGAWSQYDNTPHGAGRRILFALHSGENMYSVLK